MYKLYFLLISAIFFFGCVTVSPSQIDSRVVVENSLTKNLTIESVNTTIKNGSLFVQIKGINNSSKDLRIDYKVEWINKNGIITDSILSDWIPLKIRGNAFFNFNAIAPNDSIDNFRIQVRNNERKGTI